MARRRNYAKEYRDRVAKGKQQGLSVGQSTGHPRKGEPRKSEVKTGWQKFTGWIGNIIGGKPRQLAPPLPADEAIWGPGATGPPPRREPPIYTGPQWQGEPLPVMSDREHWQYMMEAIGLTEGTDITNWYGRPVDVEYAGDLLWEGWYGGETRDVRRDSREEFFDYMGWSASSQDFPWGQWREWYDNERVA